MISILSNVSNKPNNFTDIKDSNDFVKRIHTAHISYRDNPLYSMEKSNLTHATSTESIESGYGSDDEATNNAKCLSAEKFRDKVDNLTLRLSRYSSSCSVLNEHINNIKNNTQDINSLIKEGRSALKTFSADTDEIKGYANFLYRQVKIPGIDIDNQQKNSEIIENFTLPKPLKNEQGSHLPLKIQFTEKHLKNTSPYYELIKYKRNDKYAKSIVYIHYRNIENAPNNSKVKKPPKTTFSFTGNIQQTKTSQLREKRIRESYGFSNQPTCLKEKPLDRKPNMSKFNESIEKENLIKNQLKALGSKIEQEIKKQSIIINRLSNL